MIDPKYVFQENLRGQIFEEGKIVFDGIRIPSTLIGEPCNILFSFVTEAHVHNTKSHSHTFPHVLCFLGSNPHDYNDFDAEIEIGMGGETNTITKPSVLLMPAGLEHCPLNFKRIGKPVIFLEVMLVQTYEKVFNK